MTREEREEAIRCLSVHSSTNGLGLCTDEQHYKAKQTAIQALSQEPCEECKYKTFTELYFHTDPEMVEQEPCETCGYAEGSPFCLQYCPYDAERKKEQEPCIQEKQANADKIDAVYIDGFKAGYSQARFDLEQQPCDDCISRQYLLDNCVVDRVTMPYVPVSKIENAPPVTQKSETVTEFADRCRECGKMRKGHWIRDRPTEWL